MQIDPIKKWLGILVFTTSSIEFGCNIARINILPTKKKKVSSQGRLLFNGKELQLYNMKDLLQILNGTKNRNNYILIYESDQGQFGIEVDEIKEIIPFDEKVVEKINTEIEAGNEFIIGRIKYEGRTIILPEFDKMISFIQSKEYSLYLTK